MTNHDSDLELLQKDWLQAGRSEANRAAGVGQLIGARRLLMLLHLAEGAIATAALALTALALKHSANPIEVGLGLFVGAAITSVWFWRIVIRRRAGSLGHGSTVEHLSLIRSVRAQQARFAEFIWIVLTIDLVFLIPWWVTGSRVHPRNLTHVQQWPTFWLPILGMIVLFVWSYRMHRSARADARAIDRLRDQFVRNSE